MDNNLVVIGIPVYKEKLNYTELVSLHQIYRVLGHYPIVFIAPESLDIQYGENYKKWNIQRFSNKCFENTASYSRLLLSKSFYERFMQYKYLLIYQLDAFVFSDQLQFFCELNYDYIGAPVSHNVIAWRRLKTQVGNGGFSLRKIKSVMNVLTKKDGIIANHPMGEMFLDGEDLFFGYCGTDEKLNFSIPTVSLALKFSIQDNVMHCFNKLATNLPFGCHGWSRFNFDVWKPFIEKYGYRFDDLFGTPYRLFRQQTYIKLLAERIITRADKQMVSSVLRSILPIQCVYSIWGYGTDGKRCLLLLKIGGIIPVCIYDKNPALSHCIIDGVQAKQPNESDLIEKKTIIIISTRGYEKDIENKLCTLGLNKDEDFLLYNELEIKFVKKYYKCINE